MKKRIISFLLVVLLLSASVVPAFAADNSEVKNQYEDLKSIAEIIKMYGLFSSQDDDPIQNMLLDLLRSDPKEFYKLANTMLSHYDSHSAYLTSDENKSAFPTNVGGYVGVGITMSTDGGRIEITYVTQQSPADQAGLKAGDVIKLIDGQPVDGLTNDEIATKIRGPEGSPVTITVLRDGKELIFTMKRAQISNPNFESRTVEPGIEYMRLKIFNGTDTENRFNEAFSQLAKKGTKVLILDLRGNPGGLVSMAE
ncbi:MAG: PDZ domain-containing protein, partial [Bacillota bacterium]|nr:PDZ domain-containing protein [Bacillota bacterium]